MAQAWHKQREQLKTAQGTAMCWRATEYILDDPGNPTVIEAAPGATWERFSPFDLYRLTSRTREVEAGPHLTFLRLESLRRGESEHFHKALRLFAREYGFLGIFEEDYLQRPVIPRSKPLVAPEAIIDGQGRLQRVDPATEGKDLLLEILETRTREFHLNESLRSEQELRLLKIFRRNGKRRNTASYDLIAVPSEIEFIRNEPYIDSYWKPVDSPTHLVPWESIRRDLGAFMILDEESYLGVSVFCTREPLGRWKLLMHYFPTGNESVDYLTSEDNYTANWYLQEVSPRIRLGKDGNLEPGWNCHSLLQAMSVMLYLDLTGENTIRKCQSRGCPNYFRVGSQSKSKYCSERCANRASTRMRRGQGP
jgi:hypothetical protein